MNRQYIFWNLLLVGWLVSSLSVSAQSPKSRALPAQKPASAVAQRPAPKPLTKPKVPTLSKADSIRLARLRVEEQRIGYAKKLFRSEKYAKAFPLLARYRRSEVFDAQARLYLGKCYLKPLNAKLPNPTEAVRYLKMAAKSAKTKTESVMTLGQLYLNGTQGLAPDVNQAVLYLRQAEAAQNLQAAYLLGQLVFYGTAGIPKDEPQGIQYLEKAANAGLTEAQWTLATIYTQGTPTFPKNIKQAKVWYQKVAQARQSKLANSL